MGLDWSSLSPQNNIDKAPNGELRLVWKGQKSNTNSLLRIIKTKLETSTNATHIYNNISRS